MAQKPSDAPKAAESGWYDAGEVKPRDIPANPRCSECKTGDMFHPAHPWGPCLVPLPCGDRCPCTAHEQSPTGLSPGRRGS